MKILQLGKFYPVLGGVEKVMFDLTVGLSEEGLSEKGLSEKGFSEVGLSKVGLSEEGLSEAGLSETGLSEEGVECDMMCAGSDGRGTEVIRLNPHGRILCHRTLIEAAKTTIAPSMVTRLRRIAKDYDIIHIHHPDPMAAMALRLSGYKGKVVLHWHSDILSQKALLRFYLPIQNWLIKRADTIVGTTPVYLAESPYLQGVQEKCRCIPIGIEPVISDSAREQEIRNEYSGRRIIFSLGRLVEYKGYRYLIEAAKYLDDSHDPDRRWRPAAGEPPARDRRAWRRKTGQTAGQGSAGRPGILLRSLRTVLHEQRYEDGGFRNSPDRGDVCGKTGGRHKDSGIRSLLGKRGRGLGNKRRTTGQQGHRRGDPHHHRQRGDVEKVQRGGGKTLRGELHKRKNDLKMLEYLCGNIIFALNSRSYQEP